MWPLFISTIKTNNNPVDQKGTEIRYYYYIIVEIITSEEPTIIYFLIVVFENIYSYKHFLFIV